MTRFEQFWNNESGQGLPEYALLVSGAVVTVIIVSVLFSDSVQALIADIGGYIGDNNALP